MNTAKRLMWRSIWAMLYSMSSLFVIGMLVGALMEWWLAIPVKICTVVFCAYFFLGWFLWLSDPRVLAKVNGEKHET
jgi:ABC-type multidrug transport system permease subunit